MKMLYILCFTCFAIIGVHVFNARFAAHALTETSSITAMVLIVFMGFAVSILAYQGRVKSKLNMKNGEFEIDKGKDK